MKALALLLPLPLLLLLLAAAGPAAGQVEPQPGPALSVLVHHPYPDPADPLGVPLRDGGGNGSVDAFVARYQRYDTGRDGFGYPSLVVDGVVPVEGLPDGDGPYVATREAYAAALDQRVGSAAAAVIEVAARLEGDRVLAEVTAIPSADLSGEDLGLWVALVEDHVFYEPPAALSNGVTDHRFTVREVRLLGPAAPASGEATSRGAVMDLEAAWDRDQLYVTAWLQQGPAHGLRFDPLEVVQATTHHVAGGGVTRQDSAAKGVLVELYSATWCAPCLYGDTVIEELAQERGHPAYLADPADPGGARYWRPPGNAVVAVLGAAAGAALVVLPRLGSGGRP